MSPGSRRFPWRLVLAGLAAAVVAVTLLVPPPDASPASSSGSGSRAAVPDSAGPVPVEVPIVPDTIRVKVLNGTETPCLASRTQTRLFSASVDTVVILTPWDPADTPQKPFTETVIVSHLEDLSAARVIAGCLDLPDSSIVWEVDPGGDPASGLPDVTVCIGDDLADDPERGE